MSGGSTQHYEVPPPTPPDPYAPPRSGGGRTRPGTRTRPGERTPPNGGNGGNGHGTGGEGDATVGVYLEGDAVDEWVSMYGDFELAMAAGDADWDIEPWAPFDAAGGPDEDGYAVEIRAERLRHQSVGTAVRSGELDVFEIGGSEGNSDVVAGVDRVRISGHLFERTGRSMVLLADQYILEVDGKLDVHSHWEEGVMMAGAMEETWSDGGAIFCAMSDDLIAGGGLRCSGPLDLWVHGLMGAEERPGSAFADGVLLELSGTHYEREWGHGAHLMGLGVYSATVYQTQVSDFRQLMKVSFGVRNILPGGGGGAGEPGVTPPPGAMAAAGGPGLVMALPMFVGSLALSATRLSGAIKRFGDVAACGAWSTPRRRSKICRRCAAPPIWPRAWMTSPPGATSTPPTTGAWRASASTPTRPSTSTTTRSRLSRATTPRRSRPMQGTSSSTTRSMRPPLRSTRSTAGRCRPSTSPRAMAGPTIRAIPMPSRISTSPRRLLPAIRPRRVPARGPSPVTAMSSFGIACTRCSPRRSPGRTATRA